MNSARIASTPPEKMKPSWSEMNPDALTLRILQYRSPFRLQRAVSILALIGMTQANAELKLIQRWPVDGKVCVDNPLRLIFDQPPTLGTAGKIEVCRAIDGQVMDTVNLSPALHSDAVQIDGATATIRLHARSLNYGESYFVRVGAGVFNDFPGVTDDWKFTIKPGLPRNPDQLTVAPDGSGDFCTIQGAVDLIDPHRTKAAVISIRHGHYQELIRIGREKRFVHLVGEDRKNTVIASTNNEKLNPGWIHRSVLGVEGDEFSLENLTVKNTSPYKGSQAEAISLNAEHCVLKNADFISTQDTLHLSGSVRVTDCYIEGDVDYIWGYGSAIFEGCELRSIHDGYIVQARNPAGKPGYIFVDCKLTAGPETKRSWLARIEMDRFPASHVAFIRCEMGPHIPAAGWLMTGSASPTLRFEEFHSTDPAGRLLDVSQRTAQARQLAEKDAAILAGAVQD